MQNNFTIWLILSDFLISITNDIVLILFSSFDSYPTRKINYDKNRLHIIHCTTLPRPDSKTTLPPCIQISWFLVTLCYFKTYAHISCFKPKDNIKIQYNLKKLDPLIPPLFGSLKTFIFYVILDSYRKMT